MSCGVGRRCGSDPTLLWLWHRPAATDLIRPLAWEPPYATNAALEKTKKKKKKKAEIRNIWVNIKYFLLISFKYIVLPTAKILTMSQVVNHVYKFNIYNNEDSIKDRSGANEQILYERIHSKV